MIITWTWLTKNYRAAFPYLKISNKIMNVNKNTYKRHLISFL